MHAPWRGGREPRRAEKQPEPESAKPSRVESSRVAARDGMGACATDRRERVYFTRAISRQANAS